MKNNSNTRKKQVKEYLKKNSLLKNSSFSFKKFLYTAIPVVGMVGSTGAIVGNAVTQNNLQTSQTIAQINKTIENNNNSIINTYSSSNNSSDSTSQTQPISKFDASSTTNSDQYFSSFLDTLKDNFPTYPNVDYSRTFSKLNNGSNEVNSIKDIDQSYNGDLTTNSVLITKKDATEINEESKMDSTSNLFTSLESIFNSYKSDWLNNILLPKINELISNYNNNFYITSIIPISQYGSFDKDTSSIGSIDAYANNNDPNDNKEDSFNWENSSKLIDGSNIVSNPNIIGTDLATEGFYFYNSPMISNGEAGGVESPGAGSTGVLEFDNFIPRIWAKEDPEPHQAVNPNSGGFDQIYFDNNPSSSTSTQQDSSIKIVSVSLDMYEGAGIGNNVGGMDINNGYSNGNPYHYGVTPSAGELASNQADSSNNPALGTVYTGLDNSVTQVFVKPISDDTDNSDTYNFKPSGNDENLITLNNNNVTNIPGSVITLNTFLNTTTQNTDNTFYAGYERYVPTDWNLINHYFVFARGLLNWTLEKSIEYSYNPDTYQLQINFGNGFENVIDENGDIDKNTDAYKAMFVGDQALENQNYYYIDGNNLTNEKINTDFANYYQTRSNDEQSVLDLYNNSQLKNIIQQLSEGKDNLDITNWSSIKSTNESIFGTNTPFTITKITLPTTFNTNYGDFNVAYNDLDINASNEKGTHTTYLFNNFLPVLSSQIVIDPQSAESSYTDSSNSTGIYSQANGLKFKLSENLSQLLNIADLYNTYESQISAITPDSYQKDYPQLASNLTTFKNLFETFSFTNDNINDINTLLSDLKKGTSDSYNDANTLLTNLNSNYATYQSNRDNVLSLIGKVFNMADTSNIKDNSSSAQFIGLTPDAKETLILLPSAVKQALSNDIDAKISYGGTTETLPIWSASTQSFNTLNFDLSKTSDDLLSDDEVEIAVSDITFTDNNANTTDALTDNLNFVNNNVNQDLSYTLSEFDNAYPNNNAITTDGDSIVYKIKYNPNFANWTPNSSQIASQGIPISNTDDTTGYDATDYTSSTNIATKQNNINEAIRDFFNSVTTPTIDPTKIAIITNENNSIGFVGASYSGYVTAIEQIVNSNNLDLDPDNDSGTFYALVAIDNSQNFLNPEGDVNGVVVDGKVWYVGQNQNTPESRTYLVKMNAAKKDYDLSMVGFNYNTTDKSKIVWEINDTTSNYYYNDGADSSKILVDGNGNALQNQTITINNTKYVNWNNDVDTSNTSSSTYQIFGTSLQEWFQQFYNVSIHSYTITDNNDGTFTINVILNN